jgi:hypothetical protein
MKAADAKTGVRVVLSRQGSAGRHAGRSHDSVGEAIASGLGPTCLRWRPSRSTTYVPRLRTAKAIARPSGAQAGAPAIPKQPVVRAPLGVTSAIPFAQPTYAIRRPSGDHAGPLSA